MKTIKGTVIRIEAQMYDGKRGPLHIIVRPKKMRNNAQPEDVELIVREPRSFAEPSALITTRNSKRSVGGGIKTRKGRETE